LGDVIFDLETKIVMINGGRYREAEQVVILISDVKRPYSCLNDYSFAIFRNLRLIKNNEDKVSVKDN
jgi:hypothetical protein